ncbi:MAG: hypothetical protein U9Q30_05365 [Campylobacterota bacterium]|nr:hypothetical protein [Campylobacterota bacterium]
MKLSRYDYSFIILLLSHTIILFYTSTQFSISYSEADIFFNQNNILHHITNFFTNNFGRDDFILRLPFILFYIASSILMYLFTKHYFKHKIDSLISVAIFMMLPGVNSAGLLINNSIIVIFCLLLYLYIYKKQYKIHYLLLILFLFIDNSFSLLYLSLIIFSFRKKDKILLIVSSILFLISLYFYPFLIGGHPKSYLVDTLGAYSSIFSPFLFIYFIYAVYRIGIKLDKNLNWYIASITLVLSLILSLRQKIAIEDFAPFVIVAIPDMVRLFMFSLRVRLKQFRKIHYILVSFIIFTLSLNLLVLILNQHFYIFIENPKNYFAYKYHIAKELSQKLKKLNISDVNIDDKKMQLRLKYYGINNSKINFISKTPTDNQYKELNIEYSNKLISKFFLISKM